jgi:hypothetical protein
MVAPFGLEAHVGRIIHSQIGKREVNLFADLALPIARTKDRKGRRYDR